MKKITNLMFALVVLVTTSLFSSCNQIADKSLQLGIEEAKKDFPMSIDEGMVADDITLGENGIVYHVTVDENIYDIDALKSIAPEMKNEMIKGWKESINDDQDIKDFIETAVDFEKPINYKYEGNTSGNVARIKISVNELKQILGR